MANVLCNGGVGQDAFLVISMEGVSQEITVHYCGFSLHYMLTLYLLHKCTHSRDEHKEEEKEYTNIQYKEN